MANGSRSRHAIVIAAHADDETLGCGGTIAKLTRQGWRVDVVIVSDGVVTARGMEQDNREDARAACKLLGVDAPTFLGFPDQRLDEVSMVELSNAMVPLADGPDLVMTHATADLNRDHRLIAEAVRIAWRPQTRPVSILEFEIPASAYWNGQTFAANYFVDITDTLDVKLAALSAYTTEAKAAPHPRSPEGVAHLAHYQGGHAATGAAEAFHLLRGFEGQLP
ncbi:MAG: PIG-L family deacetylase [Acidimicrobiales bacterium]|nr:PIG-L family deacetylase [Acidimicrobiales bacterium]